MGLLGKPTILGNPQLVEYDARSLWNFWASTTSWMLRMCNYLKIGISPLLYWNVKDVPSPFKGEYNCLRIIWDWSATLLLLPGYTWFGCQTPRWETSHLLKTPTSRRFVSCWSRHVWMPKPWNPFVMPSSEWIQRLGRSSDGQEVATLSPIIMEVED